MADPISMPDVKVTGLPFVYVDPHDTARMEERRTETVYDYAGWWKASYSLEAKRNNKTGPIRSFFAHRGNFIAYDPTRKRPVTYGKVPLSGTKAAGGAFTGEAAMTDLSNRAAPQISGLPSGFQLRTGDLVEFRQSINVRSLHIIGEDATADIAGLVTLSLKWPVPEPIVQADAVHFELPSCIMKVQSKSETMTPGTSTFSFEAVEVFPR